VKILTAAQMHLWDAYTIEHESVTSINLMERAAEKCVNWLINNNYEHRTFLIFCGKGNNGGDGLAVARLLLAKKISVRIYVLERGQRASPDFSKNHQIIIDRQLIVHSISSIADFPKSEPKDIVVDALFGTGINKPLEGLAADLVRHINSLSSPIVAIDVPSGLFPDQSSIGNELIKATHTLTLQCVKMAFLMQENAAYIGDVTVLDIKLSLPYLLNTKTDFYLLDNIIIKEIYKKRNQFAHKGNFGHALIMGGSFGKIGAALLATKACLRTGAGLTTAYIPACGYDILQIGAPEAMCLTDPNFNFLTALPQYENFSAIGLGPGIGTEEPTQKLVLQLINNFKQPLVLDADALNCLSKNPESLKTLPPYSILTPHFKEFERLFGKCANDFERLSKARKKAKEFKIIIILKSHHSAIVIPSGEVYFNSTGNSGMAKGGSGDVLTGIVCALLSQNYAAKDAAILGVYLHGLAADIAILQIAKESLLASDQINTISKAFQAIQRS